jgi:hypothetical protein
MLTTKPRCGNNIDLIRARFEREVCKGWRLAGKFVWTDAELANAVSDKIRTESNHLRCDAPASQPAAAELGFQDSELSERDRRAAVLRVFSKAGMNGATRAEVSERLHCQQSSVCRTVLELLRSGELVELKRRRQSQFGGWGAVILLREFAEVRNCG